MGVRPTIDDAVALVTGASSGIGVELARQLAPRVKRLVLVARRKERLEELAAELRAAYGSLDVRVDPCDLTDREALVGLADRALDDGVTILVNNAGLGDLSMFDLADVARSDRMIELNVRALTYLTHRLVPSMREGSGVLNISSGFGLAFTPGFAVYAGTKHYVTGLTECLRLEVAPLGIAVTQACPGPVRTEFEERMGNFTGQSASAVEITADHCARASLRAFEGGKAMVVPGLLMKTVMLFQGFTPRWFLRLAMSPAGGYLRRKQEQAQRSG